MTICGSGAPQAEALAIAGAVAEADRRHGSRSARRRPAAFWRMITITSPADAAISGAPPAPGSRVVGVVVVADHGRVDVAEPVELGGAEEPDVDAPGLQPVGEDLGHADHGVGGLGQLAVADRQRQPGRLRADAARTRRSARSPGRAAAGPGWRRSTAGRCPTKQALPVVAEAAGRVDDHHVVRAGLRHSATSGWRPRLARYSREVGRAADVLVDPGGERRRGRG